MPGGVGGGWGWLGPAGAGAEEPGKLEGPRGKVRRRPGSSQGEGEEESGFGPAEWGRRGGRRGRREMARRGGGAGPGLQVLSAGRGGWVRLQAWGRLRRSPGSGAGWVWAELVRGWGEGGKRMRNPGDVCRGHVRLGSARGCGREGQIPGDQVS